MAGVASLFVKDLVMQLLIGLLAFIVAGITSFKIMFIEAQQELDELCIQNELVRLGFDARVWSKPESESLRNLLRGIANYWTRRDELAPYLRSLLDESLKGIQDELQTLTEGEVYFKWQDIRDFASLVLSEAKKGDKIYTTSYVSTPHWWLDSSGKVHDYLISKRDAADVGAEMIQIFISPDKDSLRSDENVIKELTRPTKGKPINVYAISKDILPHPERRDVLLLKGEMGSLGFELDLKDPTWVKGFYVYTDDKTKVLEEFFEKILSRTRLIKFDATKHHNFEDFVNEVFG